jgi:hypothetical protein
MHKYTENIHKYLQQQKSGDSQIIRASQKMGGFGKMLAPYRKTGGFGKCWRLKNVGALQKKKWIYKMLASCRNIGGR